MAPRKLQAYLKELKKEVIALWESSKFDKQQELIAHVFETKKVQINPKTCSD